MKSEPYLQKMRNKTLSYTNTVAYKRNKSLKDFLVRVIIPSLNYTNSNGVIYGKEGYSITIINPY